MAAGVSTPVRSQAQRSRERRSRIRRVGPHYRNVRSGRKPVVPYGRIAEVFIAAVERGEWPVSSTATAVKVDRLWLEHRLWDVRQFGWLPKGPSPLPGADPSVWLARARALLAERRAERVALEQVHVQQRLMTRERVRLRVREYDQRKSMRERALKPSTTVLDRFGLL